MHIQYNKVIIQFLYTFYSFLNEPLKIQINKLIGALYFFPNVIKATVFIFNTRNYEGTFRVEINRDVNNLKCFPETGN